MSVVTLEAVVEKGTIRLDALRTIPDRTKVFVLIPDAEYPNPITKTFSGVDLDANTEQESVRYLIKRLQHLAFSPSEAKINVTDFAGLGAELWSSIDVDAYIEKERNSWERSLTE